MYQASVTAFFDELQTTLWASFAIETRYSLKADVQLWTLHDAERQKRWEGLKVVRLDHNLTMVRFLDEKQSELQTLLASIFPIYQKAFNDLPRVKADTANQGIVYHALTTLDWMKDWHETESGFWKDIEQVDSNYDDCNVIKATKQADDLYPLELEELRILSFELECALSIVLRFASEESKSSTGMATGRGDKNKPLTPGKSRALKLYEEYLREKKNYDTREDFILVKNRNRKKNLCTMNQFETGQKIYKAGYRSGPAMSSGNPEISS